MTAPQVLDPPDKAEPPPRDLLAVLHPRTQIAARARLALTVPDGWRCEVDANSYLRLTDPAGRGWLVSPPWRKGGRWSATSGPLGKVLGNTTVDGAQAGVDYVVSQAGLVEKNVLVEQHRGVTVMRPEPSYMLDNLGDGRTAVLVGDLVIGVVDRDDDLYVGHTWTSSRTMPHATQGEVVTEIWRAWRDSEASRRAGLLPARLRHVCDSVAAVRLEDGWAVEVTDDGHVLVSPPARDLREPRPVEYDHETGIWTLPGTGQFGGDSEHRTLQLVIDWLAHLTYEQTPGLRPTSERYLVEAGA